MLFQDVPQPSEEYAELERMGHRAGLGPQWFVVFGFMIGQLGRLIGPENATRLCTTLIRDSLPRGS